MYGEKDQAKLREAKIPFTTRSIYENQFNGTMVEFSSRPLAMRALKLLNCDPCYLRHHKGARTWDLPYFC